MRYLAAAAVILATAVPGQDRARNAGLHVAFVGELETDRGRDFVGFLRAQFPRVDALERDECEPELLRFVDVVLLDWPQQAGVIQWLQNKGQPRRNPLGDLERWDRPTVLLGSAGLNVAADWGLPGTSG